MSRRKRNPEIEEEIENDVDIDLEDATSVSEGFHGRKARKVSSITEFEDYDNSLGELFTLIELNILHPESDPDEKNPQLVPINFIDCEIVGGANKSRRQLYFIGGNQELDLDALAEELDDEHLEADNNEGRQYVTIGDVFSIAYHSDKWHLEGPKKQRDGMDYEHQFGEQGGILPQLIYDNRNKKFSLSGGSYEIKDEGIYN